MTDAEKAELKAEIIRERGYWARFHDVLLERSPEFLKAYILFQSAPIRAAVLPQKLCEFIYIAIDLSGNHMYERGARRHMEYALKAGATPEEVLQVILLTTVVSAQRPLDLGMAMLRREVGGEGGAIPAPALATRDAYREATGHWPEAGDFMLSVSPGAAQSYMAYGDAAWGAGPLAAMDKELIALALCSAPTCLDQDGMRRHVKGALAAGASPAQIAAALQLSAALAIHTCTIGIPGFDDVLSGKFVE